MFDEVDYQYAIGNSDHAVLVFKYKCYADKIVQNTTRRKFHKANTAEMKTELKKINWDERFIDQDLDNMMNEFMVVYDLVQKYVPIGVKRSDIMDVMPLDEERRDIKTPKSRRVARMKTNMNSTDQQIGGTQREYHRARNKVRKRTRYKRGI